MIRARIVLYAAKGWSNEQIAACLDTPRQIVDRQQVAQAVASNGQPASTSNPVRGRSRSGAPA